MARRYTGLLYLSMSFSENNGGRLPGVLRDGPPKPVRSRRENSGAGGWSVPDKRQEMRLSCSDGFEDGGGKESSNEGRDKNSRRFTNDCSKIFRDM